MFLAGRGDVGIVLSSYPRVEPLKLGQNGNSSEKLDCSELLFEHVRLDVAASLAKSDADGETLERTIAGIEPRSAEGSKEDGLGEICENRSTIIRQPIECLG